MNEERRVCVVLYKYLNGAPRFAVLKRTKNWEGWELVKGHIEDDQDAADAALAELEEEAGIAEEDVLTLEPVDHEMSWTYEEEGETIRTVCDCFMAEVSEGVYVSVRNNPHDEHETGHFLNYRDARDILTHDNQRELLSHVMERLKERQ